MTGEIGNKGESGKQGKREKPVREGWPAQEGPKGPLEDQGNQVSMETGGQKA